MEIEAYLAALIVSPKPYHRGICRYPLKQWSRSIAIWLPPLEEIESDFTARSDAQRLPSAAAEERGDEGGACGGRLQGVGRLRHLGTPHVTPGGSCQRSTARSRP